MNPTISRRDFLKYGAGGMATIVVGTRLPWLRAGAAVAATQTLTITITDAIKEMVTHTPNNSAECYFWIYKMAADGVDIPTECPGPTIFATAGDSISISITNELEQPHSLYIPGTFDSGVIEPGQTVESEFSPSQAGAFLYYDNLNEPVNRVMGLHGGLIVMPDSAKSGHKFTPYDNPTPGVQALFDDFGSSDHFPGLAWEEGDEANHVSPFRQYLWLAHQASPNLFAEVGSLPAGEIYDAQEFMDAFLRDPFHHHRGNRIPQYFTMNGQSGLFAHTSPTITPWGRVGEPVVIHILNAGLWTHSMHLHANHFYVTCVNDMVQENPIWVDVFNIHPMDKVDYVIPFMRCPDVPNARGIGLPDTPLTTVNGHPCWPPVEELDVYLPRVGEHMAEDINGNTIDLKQRMSPLCFPMHDHSEPTQTAQGGNYNCGLIGGMLFCGDRNTPGFMDFPIDEDMFHMYRYIRGVTETGKSCGLSPEEDDHELHEEPEV